MMADKRRRLPPSIRCYRHRSAESRLDCRRTRQRFNAAGELEDTVRSTGGTLTRTLKRRNCHGDEAACAALYQHFSPPVQRLCLGLLGSVDDAVASVGAPEAAVPVATGSAPGRNG